MADKTARQRMLAGEWYQADDAELNELGDRAQRLTHRINHADPTNAELLRSLFEELLGAYGEDAFIRPPFHCDYGVHTMIGARTFANFGLLILDVAPVSIGEDVQIATNVQLLTATHPLDPTVRRAKWEAGHPITIGDNVWLAGGVVVGPGVSIGANTVVGAGSVVLDDLPANVLAAGTPARVIRELSPEHRSADAVRGYGDRS